MKGKNLIWGTLVYLGMILGTYNRRDATLTKEEAKQYGEERTTAAKGKGAGIARYRQARLKTLENPDPAFAKAYAEKTWVR